MSPQFDFSPFPALLVVLEQHLSIHCWLTDQGLSNLPNFNGNKYKSTKTEKYFPRNDKADNVS